MAYLAPGHSRRTAWAITCAVEWRRTSRPASVSPVTMATWAPSGSGELQVHLPAVDRGDDRRLGQAGADGLGELGCRRALGQLPRRAVGKTNRDDAWHRAPFPAQPAEDSLPGPDSVRGPPRVLDCTRAGPDPPASQSTAIRGRCRAAVRPRRPTGRPWPPRRARAARRACRGRRRAPPGPRPARRRHAAVRLAAAGALRHSASRAAAAGMSSSVRQSQSLAVVVRQQRQAHGGRVPLLAQVADEDEVAERLRHLRPVQTDQPDVEPEPDEGLPGHRLGLRRLALVVREHEVAPAAVDVDRLAELTQHEGRALDVPSGPSRVPSATPRPARRAATAATARSRAGPACWGPRDARRARRPARACGRGRSR